MTPSPSPNWPNRDGPGPPRCLDCGYVLVGLDTDRCPECNRGFNLEMPSTFTLKPPMLRWRLWLPGLALAVGGGLAAMYGLVFAGNWGWALWIALPFAAGSILGYGVRSRWWIVSLLGLAVITTMCFGLAAMNLAGVFCGLALAGIALGPLFTGIVIGTVLRLILKLTPFSQRWYLPLIGLALLPWCCALIEGPAPVHAVEEATTSSMFNANDRESWNAIMFYEDVQHPPPLILRIGLARPLYTRGQASAIGDEKVCMYNKGHITKRVTAVDPPRTLAFEVREQHIGYEHDVRLIGGTFAVDAIDKDHARVNLTTRYEPLLSPRWCWRPFERYAVHTLHNHVLEGMRQKAEGRTETPALASVHDGG